MARAQANGVALKWDPRGAADAPAALPIMGLDARMTRWSDAFRDAPVAHGVRARRFANRDPLVPARGGRDTAARIPGARPIALPGIGHDLPTPPIGTIVDAIAGNAARATAPVRA